MKRDMFLLAVGAVAGTILADAPTRDIAWYETAIPSYVVGTELTAQTEPAGAWSLSEGFEDRSFADVVSTGGVSAVSMQTMIGDAISFATSVPCPVDADGSVVITKMSLMSWEYGKLSDPGDVQGAFAVRDSTSEGDPEFVGHTSDGWVPLFPSAGSPAPASDITVTLKMQMDYSSAPAKVQYSLSTDDGASWTVMTNSAGASWLVSATSRTAPGQTGEKVEYSGIGLIHTLGQVGYDSTRAAAAIVDGQVARYFSASEGADALAYMALNPAATIQLMQDIAVPAAVGDTVTVDLARVALAGHSLSVDVPPGCKCVSSYDEATGLTTYTVVLGIAGSGTELDPYVIPDAESLRCFRDGLNIGMWGTNGEYFVQTGDIDLGGEQWVDIGTGLTADGGFCFNGHYDGQNHMVTNLVLSGNSYCGFFAAMEGGSIRNLRLLGVTSPPNSRAISALVGDVEPPAGKSVLFENVTVSGSIEGIHNVGGFMAWSQGCVTLVGCTNMVDVTGHHCKLGGYTPILSANSRMFFTNCCNKGNVTLLRDASNVNANLCTASGFVAYGQGGCAYEFVGCVNEGSITSEQLSPELNVNSGCDAGAFLGSVAATPVLLKDVVNTGAVTARNRYGTGTAAAGGLVARAQGAVTIDGAVSTGEVTALNDVDGATTSAGMFIAVSGTVTGAGDNRHLDCGVPPFAVTAAATTGFTAALHRTVDAVDCVCYYGGVQAAKAAAGGEETVYLVQDSAEAVALDMGETFLLCTNGAAFTGTVTGPAGRAGRVSDVAGTITFKAFPLAGSGTEDDPFDISSVATLRTFRDRVNDGTFGQSGEFFRQTADIDMQGEPDWIGVGNGVEDDLLRFKANYDGCNFTVSNLCISNDTDSIDYNGFFFSVQNATIKNLKLVNVSNTPGAASVGGVAGIIRGNSTFENVTISGTISGSYNVGGFSSFLGAGTSRFIGCTNHAAVVNVNHCKCGGFFAYTTGSNGSFLLRDCLNDGPVTHTHNNTYNNDSLAATGGFWGWFTGSQTVVFENCVNAGAISQTHVDAIHTGAGCYAGGFIGKDGSSQASIAFTNCVNIGSVVASNMVDGAVAAAGGFIGSSGSKVVIHNCDESGPVSGVNAVQDGLVSACTFVAVNTAGNVAASGVNTARADASPLGTGPCDGLNFATVSGDVATFCATPSAAGDYKVMLANALPITFGAALGDVLRLDANLAEYTGEVGTAVAGCVVSAAGPAAGVTTYTVAQDNPWNPPPADATPAQVTDALLADGFTTTGVTNGITTRAEFDAFTDYLESTGAAGPGDLTANQKDNAWACYCLGAASVPDAQISSDDIIVEAFAVADGTSTLSVSITGVTPSADALEAAIRRVLDVVGAPTLDDDFLPGNVSVSGAAAADGKVTFTVAPAHAGATTFFMRVRLNQ